MHNVKNIVMCAGALECLW